MDKEEACWNAKDLRCIVENCESHGSHETSALILHEAVPHKEERQVDDELVFQCQALKDPRGTT